MRRYFLLSSEYYLGTVPFQADPEASTLQVELVNSSGDINERFTMIDIKNMSFSTPEHVAKALNTEIQRNVKEIDKKWTAAYKGRIKMPTIEFGYDRDKTGRFWFSINKTPENFRLQLGKNDPKSILTKLGFSDDMTVEPPKPGDKNPSVLAAESSWTIGDATEHGGRSIHDQRIRSDEGFGDLRQRFEIKFGKKSRHRENLLLAEYLFSLVFFSMYREKGPTMNIDVRGKVHDHSAAEFNEKLEMVCKHQSEGLASLKEVMMEVVKKVRLGGGTFSTFIFVNNQNARDGLHSILDLVSYLNQYKLKYRMAIKQNQTSPSGLLVLFWENSGSWLCIYVISSSLGLHSRCIWRKLGTGSMTEILPPRSHLGVNGFAVFGIFLSKSWRAAPRRQTRAKNMPGSTKQIACSKALSGARKAECKATVKWW